MGKSTAALVAAHNISRKGPVLYFTLEDSVEGQQARLISNESGIPYFDLESGCVPHDRHQALTLAIAKVNQSKIWFEERRMTAGEICQAAIAFRAKNGLRCCVIDHLGFVARRGRDVYLPKYEYTSNHIRLFSFLAKELECPVAVCVQLNREVEKRDIDNRRPRLSDLRDSGTIEEDSHMVVFMYRHCVYVPHAPEYDAEMIVAKNKQGPVGIIHTTCDVKCCRIGGGREY